MSAFLFIGDEISASGFRLSGIDVFVPEPGEESRVLDSIDEKTELIILTAQVAAAVPKHTTERLMQVDKPLLMVISDMRDQFLAPDISDTLHRQLGMAE